LQEPGAEQPSFHVSRHRENILSESGGAVDRAHYLACAALLALAYSLVYGGLLVRSDFLPYVTDNNESFSSLWHAINLYHFEFSKSFGLTDEAYGFSAAAHPYVYTHQGNFPRLYATLIYALGARGIESQIFVTTFTIGLLSVYFAFHFFTKITNSIFALLTCLIMITDYVLIAQWQVVTYRVWHEFFMFSTLLCVHAISDRRKIWFVLAVLNSAALFYFEFVFVAFASLAAAFYSAALYWRTPRLFVKSWALQACGAVIGIGILATQLILYLGWTDFLQDTYLTFVARHRYSNPELLAQIREFFDSRNIVFWYNLDYASRFWTLGQFVTSITYYELQIHTPFFTVLMWIPILAVLVSVCSRKTSAAVSLHGDEATKVQTVESVLSLRVLASIGLLVGALSFFSVVALNGQYYLGIPPENRRIDLLSLSGVLKSALFALIAYGIIVNVVGRGFSNSGFRWIPRPAAHASITRFSIFVLMVAGLITLNWRLFSFKYHLLWDEIVSDAFPDPLPRILLIGTVLVSSLFVFMDPRSSMIKNIAGQLRSLCPFLVTGFAAYAIVYALSAAYIFSGYRFRIFPFTGFHTVVLISGGLYVLGYAAVYGLTSSTLTLSSLRKMFERYDIDGATEDDRGGRSAKFGTLGIGVWSSLVVVVCGYFWLSMQATYVRLLPPDHYSFLRQLARPPFKGASFVVNTYAAPIAAFTGTWAYLTFQKPSVKDGAMQIVPDYTYMWFADKRENPEYRQPKYFICVAVQSIASVVVKLRKEHEHGPDYPGCSAESLVRSATGRKAQEFKPSVELVVIDTEGPKTVGFERWAIVKLKW
jgi:hypothetical protein